PDVVLNQPDPVSLRLARSSESEVLEAVKQDIASSLQYFGSTQGSNKAYWTLHATNMLKGEVYLWSAKVYGNTADLTEAKAALHSVTGYSWLPDFASVLKNTKTAGSICALPFAFSEAESSSVAAFSYATSNCNGIFYKGTVHVYAPTLDHPLNLGLASVGGIQ